MMGPPPAAVSVQILRRCTRHSGTLAAPGPVSDSSALRGPFHSGREEDGSESIVRGELKDRGLLERRGKYGR